ncbi:hypothetical protein OX284_006745 [Flavobacterium sp. SUN046]|uniref:hypothetical protein n=1 Tax=Flavobacterium sp. SUN046 TaxID=3002440 RepID=UPI002DB5EA44|nr:hypothetical protein [Flavobacterium sp. SUN046]MEC4049121.1 hypothetical protein [Flavobacterium sp. SUN046]
MIDKKSLPERDVCSKFINRTLNFANWDIQIQILLFKLSTIKMKVIMKIFFIVNKNALIDKTKLINRYILHSTNQLIKQKQIVAMLVDLKAFYDGMEQSIKIS